MTNTLSNHVQIFDPIVASRIGLEESILIQQINYWITKCGKILDNTGEKWIYNSIKDWKKQFSYWSISKIRRIIAALEEKELIFSKKVNAKKWNHTKWYSINYEKLNTLTKELSHIPKKGRNNSTNRCVQNEQIISSYTENNYTNNSSKKEEFRKKNDLEKSKNMSQGQKMAKIWNEEFKHSLSPVKAFSTEKNYLKLSKLLEKKFSGDIEEWRKYAELVNSSQFLMGEKKTKNNFKALFSWLIKEAVVEEILSGGYGVGDRIPDKHNIASNVEKKKEEVVKRAEDIANEFVVDKISNCEEKSLFKEYIVSEKYLEDGDRYQMKHLFYNNTWLCKRRFFSDEKFKKLYNSTFESYITKKYIGKTSLEMRETFTNRIDKLLRRFPKEQKISELCVIEKRIFSSDDDNTLSQKATILKAIL